MKVLVVLALTVLLACLGGTVYLLCTYEKYRLLRDVGKFPLLFKKAKGVKRPIVPRKFLRHKYSRGSAYDRHKLRTNPHQTNYL